MEISDFHSHLLPGVDDGARDLEEARNSLRALVAEEVRVVITTPHLDASLTRRPPEFEARLAEFDAAWQILAPAATTDCPALTLRRGVELKLDIPDPDLSDPRMRLGGGPFVLVEFPYMTVPPFSARVLSAIRMNGWMPVVAHPERYDGLDPGLAIAAEWRRVGAYLQVNGGSLLGRYGPEARQKAVRLLELGWADYIASDFHARGRPRVQEYAELLVGLGGEEAARLLLDVNPGRLASGEPPLAVAPFQVRRSLLSRVLGVFR